MRLGVVTIGELVEHFTQALGLHLVGQVAGTFHALFLADQDQLGTIGGHGRLALGAGVVGHDQDHLVALDRRRHRQGNTGIARSGFDQGIAGLDLAARFGAGNHRQSRTVLDRACRVIPFELEQQGVGGVPGQALQAHQWGVADAIGDSWVLQCHGVFAIQTAGPHIIPTNARSPYHAKCGAYG